MSIYRACPNCSCDVEKHPDNGCVLNALIGIVRARQTHSEELLQDLMAHCDHVVLWDFISPLADQLAAGRFSR